MAPSPSPVPPSSARRGSCRRTSAWSVGSFSLGMYGGLLRMPASSPATGARGSPHLPTATLTASWSPCLMTLTFAHLAASGEASTAQTSAGRSLALLRRICARDTARAPLPVPRSAHGPDARPGSDAMAASARSMSCSVSGRGMRHPGPTARTRSRQWQLPRMYWIGTRSSRRRLRHSSVSSPTLSLVASTVSGTAPPQSASRHGHGSPRTTSLHPASEKLPSSPCTPATASSTIHASSAFRFSGEGECSSWCGPWSWSAWASWPARSSASPSHSRSFRRDVKCTAFRSATGSSELYWLPLRWLARQLLRSPRDCNEAVANRLQLLKPREPQYPLEACNDSQ
mmetsp:Transcript_142/g.292  ORF Transcript_142/g.292 Transcript_142/m.292 type:complete len:342 (+) Transcript_142:401-1426(+)